MASLSALCVLAVVLLARGASAQTAASHAGSCCAAGATVSVTGLGRRSFATSIAVVRLGVEASGATAAAVQAEVAKRSETLTAFLRARNVSKLQTTGVSLSAQRNFSATPPVVVGYRGSNTVSFEVPIAQAGAVLDGAVANGASQISGVSFKATPAVTEAARKAALTDAASAARAEAQVVAAALGVRLGRPRSVTVGDAFVPEPRDAAAGRFQAKAVAAEVPESVVVGGESSVSARVSIVFEQA